MGLFSKQKKEVKNKEIPSLPELPKLPDLPVLDKEEGVHKLPSLPQNSYGAKFSQDTIKGAVSGEKEDEKFPEEDDFVDKNKNQIMQEPSKRPVTEEIKEEGPLNFERKSISDESKLLEREPIFIRIDNFEEALKIFSEVKRKLHGIEKDLEDIKKIREKEDNEIQNWEKEVMHMKTQIEKVDRDVFSKI